MSMGPFGRELEGVGHGAVVVGEAMSGSRSFLSTPAMVTEVTLVGPYTRLCIN